MPTIPTSDPLGRLTLADVLPEEMHADYLAHVARMNEPRTVDDLIVTIVDTLELHPEFIKADLRLRVSWVWRVEEWCGRLLRCPKDSAERRTGRTLQDSIQVLRETFGLAATNGGGTRRDHEPPVGVIGGADCSVKSLRELTRCSPPAIDLPCASTARRAIDSLTSTVGRSA